MLRDPRLYLISKMEVTYDNVKLNKQGDSDWKHVQAAEEDWATDDYGEQTSEDHWPFAASLVSNAAA